MPAILRISSQVRALTRKNPSLTMRPRSNLGGLAVTGEKFSPFHHPTIVAYGTHIAS
jgi:hypothetical protein